ncbi:uncharacterized protein [Magallana gigas]|uniref:uncharacterized protein isoform X2 n=1 Tax=Magallana gigas TaxID=29159 RepID=UPI0033418096
MNADITGGCSFCGQRSTNLLRCSRCKEVYYCSKDCQRGHWKEGHRKHCVAVNNQVPSMGENQGNVCSFCEEESPDLLKCSRCKEVYYCSKDCQRGHWREGHREDCKDETASSDCSLTYVVCNFCNIKSHQPKKCTGCKAVSYCSKECQTQDWSQRHKNECKKIRNEERQSFPDVNRETMINKVEATAVSKDLEFCPVCGYTGKLKLCQRCKKIKYCSVECQKADWKKHKLCCSSEENKVESSGKGTMELLPICAHCKNRMTTLTCQDCKYVYYCSETCKNLDWAKHKAFCRSKAPIIHVKEVLSKELCTRFGLVTPEEHQGKNPNDGTYHYTEGEQEGWMDQFFLCSTCSKNPAEIECSYCNWNMYCSNRCRDLDKTAHKEVCNSYGNFFDRREMHKTCSFVKGQFKFAQSPIHATMPVGRHPMFADDGADLTLIKERTKSALDTALIKTQNYFPNNTLITRIREIPIEKTSEVCSNICTQPLVFLSYIRRYHKYRGRHNVYLQDSERREIYVGFYLPNDDPLPYFQWKDLVPGKFIAILLPCIHFYNDRTVGLRIDNASHVYCFDVEEKV